MPPAENIDDRAALAQITAMQIRLDGLARRNARLAKESAAEAIRQQQAFSRSSAASTIRQQQNPQPIRRSAVNDDPLNRQMSQLVDMHTDVLEQLRKSAAADAARERAAEAERRRHEAREAAAIAEPSLDLSRFPNAETLSDDDAPGEGRDAEPNRGLVHGEDEGGEESSGGNDPIADPPSAGTAAALLNPATAPLHSASPTIPFARLALAVLYIARLRGRSSGAVVAEEEARKTIDELAELSATWLKIPVRPLVQSVLSDSSQSMDLSAAAGGGSVRRSLALARPRLALARARGSSKSTSATAAADASGGGASGGDGNGGGTSGGSTSGTISGGSGNAKLDDQAISLRDRAKAVLDAVLGSVQDAPPQLLRRLHTLCYRRVHWPSDFALLPSEKAALRLQASGCYAPTEASPRLLAVQLVLTRVLLQRLLLRPREHGLASGKPPSQGASNLKMLAAYLHLIFQTALVAGGGGRIGAGGDARVSAVLEQDAEASRGFSAELTRLMDNAPPLLHQYAAEAATGVLSWSDSMLRVISDD